jgi:hypothetical protein
MEKLGVWKTGERERRPAYAKGYGMARESGLRVGKTQSFTILVAAIVNRKRKSALCS